MRCGTADVLIGYFWPLSQRMIFHLCFSGRGRNSPKQRLKEQLSGGMTEADKDHLITEDSDAAYRKCPGVNNVAYVVST